MTSRVSRSGAPRILVCTLVKDYGPLRGVSSFVCVRYVLWTIGALLTAVALLFALWLRNPLAWLVLAAVFLASYSAGKRLSERE